MEIEVILDSVSDLPPTPQILPKLQSLLKDDNSTMEDIVKLVKMDAPLTAKVVRLSNSVFFGSATPSKNIEDAVNRLGFQEVYKVVSLVASQLVLGGGLESYKLKEGELWKQSVYTAIAMETIGTKVGQEASSLYTIGLLHSIGKAIINRGG